MGDGPVHPTLLGDGRTWSQWTNLVLSSGLRSTDGLSLAREGPGVWNPGQDSTLIPKEEEVRRSHLFSDSDVQGGTSSGKCGSGWVRRQGGGQRLTGQEHLCHGDRNEG